MLKKATYLLVLLMATGFSGRIQAQIPYDIFAYIQSAQPGSGTVKIKQNADVTNMINLHLSLMRNLKGIKGYRVCIYYNSGQQARSAADQERARFISRYEDVSSDKVFESPFWKVYVGDFRTKSEALKFLERIRFDYPNAFIRDNITVNFPR
jgi:hypothetical protein